MLTPHFVTFAERPDLLARWIEQRDPWRDMEWMYHDPVCEGYWHHLRDDFGDFQFLVYEDDAVLGEGRAIPFSWSGRDEDLPDGVDEVLPLAVEHQEEPNTLCAILAVVDPGTQRKGVSAEILKHMASMARDRGCESLVAPVRPSLKHLYPLASMESYAQWRRPDGHMFDPWLRTHERLGARYAGVCPNSNIFKGTVAEWEEWTELTFFESGEYLAPRMMNPFHIDLDAGEGTYIEPNVWMVHDI